MVTRQEFNQDTFLGKYEQLIRENIGNKLDSLHKQLKSISSECTIRLMNLQLFEKKITINDLLQSDSKYRRQVLSAILYNDALWRFEAAYLMLCIGLINISYANLRDSLEALVEAFIVERVDAEANNFLEGRDVNPKAIEQYINSEYNNHLLRMKKAFGDWGVHTSFESVIFTSLFGPSRFDKTMTESPKINKTLKLPDGFVDEASKCIEYAGFLGVIFSWLMSKSVPN